MKISFAFAMLMSASVVGLAQISGPPVSPETNFPSVNLMETNQLPRLPNPPPVLPVNPAPSKTPLAPGIYLTKPYTCMVKVPGAQNDQCVLPMTTNSVPIQNVKPGLQFVPLPPAGK